MKFKAILIFVLTGSLVFMLNGLACCILFFRVAILWPKFGMHWQKVEMNQIQYGYPSDLKYRIRKVTIIILTVGLGEYFLKPIYF